jgi:hypothetical protein
MYKIYKIIIQSQIFDILDVYENLPEEILANHCTWDNTLNNIKIVFCTR